MTSATEAIMTEHTFTIEAEARSARRDLINRGTPVSLLSFDNMRGVYAFDAECCDGTGWTGDPRERCAEHYESLDAIWFGR